MMKYMYIHVCILKVIKIVKVRCFLCKR